MAQPDTFTSTARWLHWLIAGLIVLQYVLAEAAEEAASDLVELALLAQHKSVGITVLALALLRLGWRLYAGAPAWPQSMPPWQHTASRVSHWAFYTLLLALPLSGWLLSSAAAYSVSWFNLVPLPDLVAPSEGLEEVFEAVHEGLAKGLFVLALVHIAAALKHLFADRDGVFQRMWSWPAVGAAFALAVIGIVVLMPQASAPDAPATTPRASDESAAFHAAPHAPWQVDYERSSIRFTAEQAGAPFQGSWDDWQADIRMQGVDDAFSAEVIIRTNAVSTGDTERDSTLQGGDWFDVANYPEARFSTDTLRTLQDGSFEAPGNLTIRGANTPVVFRFAIDEQPNGVLVLNGNADLDRLALGVGTGEWLDTTWVGADVTLAVTLFATRS